MLVLSRLFRSPVRKVCLWEWDLRVSPPILCATVPLSPVRLGMQVPAFILRAGPFIVFKLLLQGWLFLVLFVNT